MHMRHSPCALEIATRALARTAQQHADAYAAGDYDLTRLPNLNTLSMVRGYIRIGICRGTRHLGRDELPDLAPMLAKLPEPLRAELAAAIAAEEV